MNKIHEWVNTALIGVVLLLVLVGGQSAGLGSSGTRFPNGLSTDSTSPTFGQLRTTSLLVTTGGATVGSSGTSMTQVLNGTCNLIINDTSIVASTTKRADCVVAGVVAGDRVFASFSSTSPSLGTQVTGGIVLNACMASTTSGFIACQYTNLSGGTINTAGSFIGSSTQYYIVR